MGAIDRRAVCLARNACCRNPIRNGPLPLLVDDVAAAIVRATDFDGRELNYNFDFDWQAYKEVQRGF